MKIVFNNKKSTSRLKETFADLLKICTPNVLDITGNGKFFVRSQKKF